MYGRNVKINKKIFIGLLVGMLLCLYSIVGMASASKSVPSSIKKYIGKTYWIKTHYFGDGTEAFVNIVSNKKKLVLDKNEFFTKVKVTGYEAGKLEGNFIAVINGKTCSFVDYIITSADVKDYSIFTKDPKTIYKWSKDIWLKLCKLDPFSGMTPDMLKMIRGNCSKLNKNMKTKYGTADEWVYLSDLGNEFYFFKSGKLYTWTI
jgi:hypothetical protein